MVNVQRNAVETSDRTGQQLGNYRLIRSLELRRFSGTYAAEHVQFKQQRIVKVWQTCLKEELVNSFLTQSHALFQLIHPHILPVRDAGVENLVPFVVMEYVSCIPLWHQSSRGVPQPLSTILPFVGPVAEALQYAHNNGFLHKQVRPRNILLGNSTDTVLLSNFTIDAVAQSEEPPNLLKEKEVTELLGYMAPEQMQAHALPASDQYALAMIIYEWLSGRLPFRGSYGEIVKQQLSVQPPSLRRQIPRLSPQVEEVIFTALSKDPKKRFNDMTTFLTALQQANAVMPAYASSSARRVSSPPPKPFKPSTNPTLPAVPAQSAPIQQATPPVVPFSAVPMAAPVAAPAQATRIAIAVQPPPILPVPVAPPASLKSTPQQMPAPVQKTKSKAFVSRRAFIAGLVGVAVVGGGAAWLELSQHVALPQFGGGPSATSTPQVNPNPQKTDGTLLIYRAHPVRVSAVSWSPDGSRIASASDDHTVQICDAKTGKTLLIYRGHADQVYAASWSPDGKYIASGGADKTVQVWNAETGVPLITYSGHTNRVNALAWSSHGKLIASGSDDQTVQVWNATSGAVAMIYAQHTAGVLCVAWSPDSTAIASGSWDNTVQAFSTIQTQSFAIGGTIFNYAGHAAEVYSVSWSPDGSRIASASADKVVQVGSGINGATIFSYMGHSDVVSSVAWSPDGSRIASASADTTVQIWSANVKQKTTSQKLFTYRGHSAPVDAVAWAPSGKFLASGSFDHTLQVWQPI